MNSGAFINRLRENRFLAGFLTDAALVQLKKYLITGFTTAAIETALLWFFRDMAGLTVVVANSIAITIVFWFNFLVNRYWSFKSKDPLGRQLLIYGCLFSFNLGASNLIMYTLADLLGINLLLAKLFAIGAIVCWNFVIYKKIIFKK